MKRIEFECMFWAFLVIAFCAPSAFDRGLATVVVTILAVLDLWRKWTARRAAAKEVRDE